jgi:hypothetical protein
MAESLSWSTIAIEEGRVTSTSAKRTDLGIAKRTESVSHLHLVAKVLASRKQVWNQSPDF